MVRKPSRLLKLAIAALLAGAPAWLATRRRSQADLDPNNADYQAALRQYDLAKRESENDERRFRLFRQKVYLGITVVLVAVAIVYLVQGGHSTAPWIAGGTSFVPGIAAIVEGRRAKGGSDE